jgi:predicted small secreted protein
MKRIITWIVLAIALTSITVTGCQSMGGGAGSDGHAGHSH